MKVKMSLWESENRHLNPASPIQERHVMSKAMWCDIDDADTNAFGQTGHPFSSLDLEAQHFSNTRHEQRYTGNSYGTPTYQEQEVIVSEVDMCGYHMRAKNPFGKKSPEAIAATVAEDEESNRNWQEGYDAAIDHVLSGEPRGKHGKD
jgi:hypothetical protein